MQHPASEVGVCPTHVGLHAVGTYPGVLVLFADPGGRGGRGAVRGDEPGSMDPGNRPCLPARGWAAVGVRAPPCKHGETQEKEHLVKAEPI